MIVFEDKYSDDSIFLKDTLMAMNAQYESVLLQDIHTVPEHMISMCEAFVQQKEAVVYQEKELHCAFLSIPPMWQVRMDNLLGAVYNLEKRKATIYYTKPQGKRIVERVEWLSDSGYVYKIDYYNKYGWKYCSELKGISGGVSIRTYYTSKGEEIISHDLQTGQYILFEGGSVKTIYDSITGLEKELFSKVIQSGEAIILTSWRQVCLLREVDVDGNANVTVLLHDMGDVEKYQEFSRSHKTYPMFILNNTHTAPRRNMTEENDSRICYVSTVDKPVNSRGDILILTSLDQLEGIVPLITSFSDINFHIAAHTLVSDKLLALEEYSNVKIYPQISKEQLQGLLESCSFYLDIGLGWEIHNIVIRASMYKMLILGFEHTLRNPYYVLPECVFSREDCQGFITKLRSIVGDDSALQDLLGKQTNMAEETVKALAMRLDVRRSTDGYICF